MFTDLNKTLQSSQSLLQRAVVQDSGCSWKELALVRCKSPDHQLLLYRTFQFDILQRNRQGPKNLIYFIVTLHNIFTKNGLKKIGLLNLRSILNITVPRSVENNSMTIATCLQTSESTPRQVFSIQFRYCSRRPVLITPEYQKRLLVVQNRVPVYSANG